MDAPTECNLLGASFEEAEAVLEMIYRQYKSERSSALKCRKVHSYLFRQLEVADCVVKKAVLRILKKIKRDIVSIDCDVLSLLEARDVRVRATALKMLRMFWPFYEFDEVVVYAIRKHSMFYGPMRSNPKYSQAFARRISEWESRGGKNATRRGSGISSLEPPQSRSSAFYNELANINDIQALKQHLETHLDNCEKNKNIIFSYFIEKIAHYMDSADVLIPGIRQFKPTSRMAGNKVDGDFKLELLGLKATAAYRRINGAFDRVAT